MNTSDNNIPQSLSLERLDDFRCNLDGIVLDSLTPENTTGAFGDLFTATHPIEGKLALKRPRGGLHNSKAVAAIEIEAGVWKRLQHPHILQFLGIHTIDDSVYFVSPYAENGSLPEFIQRRPEVDRKRLVIEIADGLVYLHQCGIVHGDLKGNNVLISKAEHVLICDLGLAKHVTSRTATSLRGVGSLAWQSPEMLQNARKKTFESDVYAFGITVYEVLSGKEPYSHHLGPFSIISGVVMTGERPPKDPSAGSDGSSYLEFWEEAEKCWDGDPTRRPSMRSVLRRLDRQRYEMLVTSQQLSLETSLDTDDQAQTHLQAVKTHPPFYLEGELLEPLEWARRIQVRIHGLYNMRRPISRLSTETITGIILEASPVASLSDTNAYISTLTRWARLRTVCKAWCRAMDNTPEFWRHIWVSNNTNNIASVKRLQVPGPFRCLISGWHYGPMRRYLPGGIMDALPLDRISELRGHLEKEEMILWLWYWCGHYVNRDLRLTSLTISLQNASEHEVTDMEVAAWVELANAPATLLLEGLSHENFEPGLFRGIQVLTMVGAVVGESFVERVGALICIAPGIIELTIRSIKIGKYYDGSFENDARWTNGTLPDENCSLHTVRLIGLDCSVATTILHRLTNCRLKLLEVDNLDPECLNDRMGGGSAIVKGLGSLSPSGKISVMGKRQMTYINFATPGGLGADDNDEGWKLESARIGFLTKQASDWRNLFGSLPAIGIHVPHDGVEIAPSLDHNYPTALSQTKLILVEIDSVVSALRPLAVATHDGLGPVQYPCPLLKELILVGSVEENQWSTLNGNDFQELCNVVAWRQQIASHTNQLAKLRRLVVPSDWIGRIERAKRTYPAFQGIEVYDSNDFAFF